MARLEPIRRKHQMAPRRKRTWSGASYQEVGITQALLLLETCWAKARMCAARWTMRLMAFRVRARSMWVTGYFLLVGEIPGPQ